MNRSLPAGKLPYVLSFIVNGVITYFALAFMLFAHFSLTFYIATSVFVIGSCIVFTLYPRYRPNRVLWFFIKPLLHSVVSYLIISLFVYINEYVI